MATHHADAPVRAPASFWIIAGLSLPWNGFGAFDYVMTQTRNRAYLAQFTPEQVAWFEQFPPIMSAAWAIGVWGSVLGSILLLMRSRHAVPAFVASVAGLAVSTVFQFTTDMPDSLRTAGMIAMNAVIWGALLFFLLYAVRMVGRGVLR